MTGVLLGLLWITVAVLALILLALSLPYHLRLEAGTEPVPRLRLELRPFAPGGPVVLRLDSRTMRDAGARRPDRPRRRLTRRARRSGGAGGGRALRALRGGPVLIRRLAGAVRLDFLRVTGCLGLDDPADTGQLFGALAPVLYLPLGSRVRLDLRPVFDRCAASGELALGLRVVPLRLVLPVAAFGLGIVAGRR